MTPRRGDRVVPPLAGGEWNLRYADKAAVLGWGDLCAQEPGNTRACYEALLTDPCPDPATSRQHPMRGPLAERILDGVVLPQWQYEVTGGGRVWYLVDEARHQVWLTFARRGHPKQTDT